jgi:hypothetical protein
LWLENLPLGVLHDTPVLRPGKPSRTWLSLLLLVKYADDAWYITTVWCFWHAPHSEIAI